MQELKKQLAELEAELAAERKRIRELEVQIEMDPLVDVLNRRGFYRELRRAITNSCHHQISSAVIFIDLDNFKTINDRWGHPIGDEVLKAVAKAISRAVRVSDIVARVGGDEFAALLWHVNEPVAFRRAKEIEQIVATEIPSPAGRISIGASAGVAMVGPFDRPDDLMAAADERMYSRKPGRRGFASVA